MLVVIAMVAVLGTTLALDNGVGYDDGFIRRFSHSVHFSITPAMGYSTWNEMECGFLDADSVMGVAAKMVEFGLTKLGYEYVNIDDCWAQARHPNGSIYANPITFPHGIAPVADYVHGLVC